jgi:hypothetical protein
VTDNLLLLAAIGLLRNRAKSAYDTARIQVEKDMKRSDRLSVWDPEEKVYLGAVSKSNPEKTAGVGDAEAFLAWVKATYPDDVDWDMDIVGPDDEVKAVLYQHAKHLVKLKEIVKPSFRASVLEASNAAKEAAGPGGELDVPGIIMSAAASSNVSFRPSPEAAATLTELIRNGTVKVPDLLDVPDAPDGDA